MRERNTSARIELTKLQPRSVGLSWAFALPPDSSLPPSIWTQCALRQFGLRLTKGRASHHEFLEEVRKKAGAHACPVNRKDVLYIGKAQSDTPSRPNVQGSVKDQDLCIP